MGGRGPGTGSGPETGGRRDPSVEAGGADEPATCPYCGSDNTEREHPKGPSLCRSMHYCNDCQQPFEAMHD